MRKSNELQIGKAGEYLVCADLIMKGLIAYPSEQGLPYDVVIDIGSKLLKCQVKTTLTYREIPQRKQKSYAYIFNIKRHGNNNLIRYDKNEVDIFALCCLDTRKVGYLLNKETPDTINIRVDKLKGDYYDEKGIINYNKIRELNKKIKNQSEISRQLNIDVSIVNKMLKSRYKPHKTNAKYFSDFIRNEEWFKCL